MDRLYWVDYQLEQIGHIGIEGYDRQTFTNIGQITQPYSLTIYSGESVSLSSYLPFHLILHMHNIIQIKYVIIQVYLQLWYNKTKGLI